MRVMTKKNGVFSLIALSIASFVLQFRSASDISKDEALLHKESSDFVPWNRHALRTEQASPTVTGKCAINMYGLPRAFQSLVLPSLIKNVIQPNAIYSCDYFVHYYNLTEETAGRSGGGGRINPDEILLFKQAVQDVSPQSIVEFHHDTEAAFWDRYQPLLDKIRTTKATDGHYLYFPWRAKTYKHPITTDNIIKMWHSIQSAWNLMMEHETLTSQSYTRVAMLRSDVVYMTPINVFEISRRKVLDNEKAALVPAFGRHPVSDRIIVGPRDAVKVWATERFDRLETHVTFVQEHNPGWGMHSEKFLNWTIFPAIRETGTSIVEDDYLCFFRARADETVWISDCRGAAHSILKNLGGDKVQVLESVLGRSCENQLKRLRHTVEYLHCPKDVLRSN
jgi:hypothetical protein